VGGNFEYVYPGAVAKSSTIGPLAGMEPVAHDLPARARQLESLARMACLHDSRNLIYKKHSTLSSIE
jgi:hypothetical protein